MEQRYLSYHGEKEQKKLIKKLEDDGYINTHCLSWDNYRFPIFVVDDDNKIFFGTNTTCMAGVCSGATVSKK